MDLKTVVETEVLKLTTKWQAFTTLDIINSLRENNDDEIDYTETVKIIKETITPMLTRGDYTTSYINVQLDLAPQTAILYHSSFDDNLDLIYPQNKREKTSIKRLINIILEVLNTKNVVCETCKDSHQVHLSFCTRCPTPCQNCREGGNGPYCANTPCHCACHNGMYLHFK